MTINLGHAFTDMDPDDHRISRVLMVGAYPGKGRGLSDTDRSLMQHALSLMETFKIPLSDDLKAVTATDFEANPSSYKIINILSEYGGEDFLHSHERGDLVVLCNIKKDVDPDCKIDPATYNPNIMPTIRRSFLSSAEHDNLAAWNNKILESGAKAVVISGVDNFSANDFCNSDFIKVGMENFKGVLFERNFASRAETFLMLNDSPLADIIGLSDENKEQTFYYDTYGSDPFKHKIKPRALEL